MPLLIGGWFKERQIAVFMSGFRWLYVAMVQTGEPYVGISVKHVARISQLHLRFLLQRFPQLDSTALIYHKLQYIIFYIYFIYIYIWFPCETRDAAAVGQPTVRAGPKWRRWRTTEGGQRAAVRGEQEPAGQPVQAPAALPREAAGRHRPLHTDAGQ